MRHALLLPVARRNLHSAVRPSPGPSPSTPCHPPSGGSVLAATSCLMCGPLSSKKQTTCGGSGLQFDAPCWTPSAKWTALLGAPLQKGAPLRRTTLRARHRRHRAALGFLIRPVWRQSEPDWLLCAMSAFKPIDAHMSDMLTSPI